MVIEPVNLAAVGRSYVLGQSDLYLGADGGEIDTDKLLAEDPDLVVFNGYAYQNDHRPLRAQIGERVRIWGARRGTVAGHSFHVVGNQIDTVYTRGCVPTPQPQRRQSVAHPAPRPRRLGGTHVPLAGTPPLHLPRHGRRRTRNTRNVDGHPGLDGKQRRVNDEARTGTQLIGTLVRWGRRVRDRKPVMITVAFCAARPAK